MTFLAPVALGAILDFEATRVAVVGGRRVIQVRVRAGETDVALGEAIVDPLPTAFVFPGQGIQRRGLGAEGRPARGPRVRSGSAPTLTRARCSGSRCSTSSSATRASCAWPTGACVRHPSGVLFRTEFTQPALVALAAAQFAELRAEGALGDDVTAAGHSVGEFSALHALGALSLEDALTLVHRRGDAMQAHVPRDADGTSPYRLAVVDPAGADVEALLADDPVEIVNHNATGRQYAVAGTADALAALEQRLGKRVVRVLPGIDVPFHSSVLAPRRRDVPRTSGGRGASMPSGWSGAGSRTSPAARSAATTTSSICWRASSPRRCAGSRCSTRSRVRRADRGRAAARRRAHRPRPDDAGRHGPSCCTANATATSCSTAT